MAMQDRLAAVGSERCVHSAGSPDAVSGTSERNASENPGLSFESLSHFELSAICRAVEEVLVGYDTKAGNGIRNHETHGARLSEQPGIHPQKAPETPGLHNVSGSPWERTQRGDISDFLQELHRKLVSLQRRQDSPAGLSVMDVATP